MKRKTFIHAAIAGSAMSFMVAGTLIGVNQFNKKLEKADAYSTQTACPTTIDLKDNSASDIRSYYASLNNLSTSERQGTNLLKNLKPILKNGQKYWNYDSGNTVWQMYEIIDRDWEKSPKTSISGYNSSTNKITGYTYGTSTSNKGTNPYLHALYINRNVTNQVTAWDDHQQTQWGINREHVWAKSHGFDDGGTGGARGDPMHLWAGNGYANNIHSNLFFGFVNTSGATDCGNKYSNLSGNLKGTSLNLGSGTVFEPQDCDKGDIARAIFYMAARYNYYSGSDSDGIDSANPNLKIVDSASDSNGSTSYESSTTKAAEMGIMRDLLAWNRLDPPDEWEIHRNNLCYNNFTNNRNPFIDYPEWAEYIWGKPTLATNNRTITSFSTTPTGYAIPSSDSLNTFGNAITTPTITLNKSSATLPVNGTVTLTATAMGGSGNVSWTTSNSSRATISASTGDSIVVTGKATGSATITASYSGVSATCTITVSATAPTVSSVTVSPATLSLDLNGTTTGNLSATVTGTNSPAQTVTWTSGNENVATVNSSGTVSAVAVGSTTIRATSTVDDTKYGSCTVTVSNSGSTSSSGTFTISFDGSLNSSTTYITTETTTQNYNGGDATATLVFNQLNPSTGQLKGNQNTASNMQAGSNFYIRNTSALPGNVREISINGLTCSGTGAAIRPANAYAKTGSSAITSQTTSDSTAGSGTENGSTASWSFTGNSGKFFAISCAKGFTGGTVKATTITVSYEGTGGSTTPAVTGVSISPTRVQLTAGGEGKTLTAAVSVENNADDSVTWSSSNSSIARVNGNGEVTPVAAGTATITATSVFDNTKSGTATIEVKTPTVISSSPYMNGVPYKMYCVSSSKNYYFTGSMSGYYGASNTNVSSAPDMFFETNGSGQNMYFINGSGEKQYVVAAVSGSYTNFTLTATTPSTPWLYDSTTGGMTFALNSSTYYLGMSGTYTTFSVYTSSSINHVNFVSVSSSGSVGLATIIINNVVCQSNGSSAPTFSSLSAWSQLSDICAKLDSTLQSDLESVEADEEGNIVQKAMAKYDYIVGKYGTTNYANFLNRSIANSSNRLAKPIVSNDAMVLLVIMSVLGTLTFAAWFIRKKKQYDL